MALPAQHRNRRRWNDQGDAADGQRRAVLHRARSRLGGGCAHGSRTVALPLGIQRRHPHRQSRRRHLRQLAVFRNSRLSPGLTQHQGRLRALAKSHLRPRPDVFRLGCARGCRQPRDCRSQRRRSGYPRISRVPRPGDRRSASGAGTWFRRSRAIPARRPGRMPKRAGTAEA